jgi:hypothetical protein
MRHWLILLIALTSVSCATAPVELPDWDLAERDKTKQASEPIVLPGLCEIPASGSWPLECWKKLDAHDIAAEANYIIAQENAAALRSSDNSYDELLGSAKVQQELSEIRQEMLERERQAHTMDNWFYRIIIALGLIGAAL